MTHPLPYISPAADAAERERLEEIYRAYPKHVGKPKALQAIASAVKRLRKERPELDALAYLKQRTEAFAKVRQRIHEADKTQERFTPHPSTWFHQSRYDDDESTWGNAGGNGKHNGASPHSVGPSLTRPVYRS